MSGGEGGTLRRRWHSLDTAVSIWRHDSARTAVALTELTSGTPINPGRPRSGVVEALNGRSAGIHGIAAGADIEAGVAVVVAIVVITTTTITITG